MNARYGFCSFSKKRTFLSNGIRFLSRPKDQDYFLSKTQKLCLNIQESRNYSTESDEKSPKNIKLPPLMNFPRVIWPSILRSFKNTILSYVIIKPNMDYDFDLNEFVLGSKKAVHVVSKKLSTGEDLSELVTDDIIPVLQSRLSVMSVAQREWLAIDEEDIYFSFPYQVGIMFNDDDQKRFVEILMVHHSLKGLGEMKSRGNTPKESKMTGQSTY
ncbi:uncharacterized protein LOC123307812 isoform X2 [Coccinella septempunctata]|uniref:uncharacterized protein LOC123307812 isoform X2 n=1 Tax=Coccinella septempunctata TaxID=41139 RepID=UPI001D0926E5|nr:uncharacterized protein LOC123307812 isoform X2 [Coccinella septempunctata]